VRLARSAGCLFARKVAHACKIVSSTTAKIDGAISSAQATTCKRTSNTLRNTLSKKLALRPSARLWRELRTTQTPTFAKRDILSAFYVYSEFTCMPLLPLTCARTRRRWLKTLPLVEHTSRRADVHPMWRARRAPRYGQNTFSHAFMCLYDTRPACAPRQPRESDGDVRRAERVEKKDERAPD